MASDHHDQIDQLIMRVYDAALEPALWTEVLHQIAEFCNARGAFVFEMTGKGDERNLIASHISSIYDRDTIQSYLDVFKSLELEDQDFFASKSKKTDAIEMIPDTELVAAANGEVYFEQPHMAMQMKYGFKHRGGALLNKDDYFRDRLGITYSVDHGPINEDDIARAARIVPHLAKSLNVAKPALRASGQFASMETTLDHLQVGICVVDGVGRVVFKNAEFERQADVHRAFAVSLEGKLQFSQDRFDKTLIDLLDSYAHHGKFGARPRKEAVATATDADGNFSLCVEVVPLRKANLFGGEMLNGHVVYSLDTSQSYDVRSDMLAKLFNLTKSEGAVLELMAEGLTNGQISERRTKSIHTINSQVKSILSKTQAANRTQLIRLATNLSSSFVPDAP
jgi:DNA-binding CsgD family transcriptional regulator/PAS domain-containing protein